MRGLTRDTVVELVDRKILWLFGIVTAIMLLIVYGTGNMHASFSGPSGTQELDFSQFSASIVANVLDGMFSFLLFLTVMATTGLLPKMLEKGRADFYLSKPNSRARLLLGKFAAVWAVYGGLLLVCGVLILGLVAIINNLMYVRLLYFFVVYILLLFVWLSVVALTGVALHSTVLTIMATFLVWVAQTILAQHDKFSAVVHSKAVLGVIDALYYVLPKHGEIGAMAVNLASGQPVESWMPLWSSLLFGLVILYLAVFVFRRRNY